MHINMKTIIAGISFTGHLILTSENYLTENDPQDEFGFIICSIDIVNGKDNALVRLSEQMRAPSAQKYLYF